MNNKGWGLKEFIMLLSILGISLIVVIVLTYKLKNGGNINSDIPNSFGGNKDVSIKEYIELEDKIVGATKNYLEKDTEDKIIVKLETLIEKSYIKNVRDPKNNKECSGYVIYDGSIKEYKAYLSCPGNYQTSDYNSKLE